MYFLTAKQAPTRPLHGQFLLPGHISARYLHGMASPHFLCSNVTSSERLSLTTCCKIIASLPTRLTERVGMRERSCSHVFAPGIKCLPPVILKSTSPLSPFPAFFFLSSPICLLFISYYKKRNPMGARLCLFTALSQGPSTVPVHIRCSNNSLCVNRIKGVSQDSNPCLSKISVLNHTQKVQFPRISLAEDS